MKTSPDNRTHKRFDLANQVRAVIKIIENKVGGTTIDILQGNIVDISYGGMRLITTGVKPDCLKALELDTYRVKVAILTPNTNVEIMCRIRWTQTDSDGLRVLMGVRFVDADFTIIEAIQSLLLPSHQKKKKVSWRWIGYGLVLVGITIFSMSRWRDEALRHRQTASHLRDSIGKQEELGDRIISVKHQNAELLEQIDQCNDSYAKLSKTIGSTYVEYEVKFVSQTGNSPMADLAQLKYDRKMLVGDLVSRLKGVEVKLYLFDILIDKLDGALGKKSLSNLSSVCRLENVSLKADGTFGI